MGWVENSPVFKGIQNLIHWDGRSDALWYEELSAEIDSDREETILGCQVGLDLSNQDNTSDLDNPWMLWLVSQKTRNEIEA